MIRTTNIARYLGLAVLVLGGVLFATTSYADASWPAKVKHLFAPDVEMGNRPVDLVGIFGPGFEPLVDESVQSYIDEWGDDVQVIEYRGHTLIVPPGKGNEIDNVRESIDQEIFDAERVAPSKEQRQQDIAFLGQLFGSDRAITYDTLLRGYSDQLGYQYDMKDGILLVMGVGRTEALNDRWHAKHPESESSLQPAPLAENIIQSATEDFLRDTLPQNEVVDVSKVKLQFTPEQAAAVYSSSQGETHRVLWDRLNGEILSYNRGL